MWGVDDQIRDLFAKVLDTAKELPDSGILEVKELFEAFAQEFEAHDLQGRVDPLDDFAGGLYSG